MTAQYPFTIQQRHGDVWLTAAGENFGELYTHACELFGEEKANELLALAQAESVVREAGMTPPPAPPAQASRPASGPPTPPAGPRSGPPRSSAPASSGGDDWKANPPMCEHGEMRPYEGSNSRGPYKAWFCSGPRDLPRDQKCTPLDGVTFEPWK